ncbi:MAG: preprotein translocase subunit SecG [bacterium]
MKETLINLLPYIQLALSILLIAIILLNRSEAGVGSSFGGSDNFNSGFHTRRGFEKVLFIGGAVIAALFAVSALAALYLKK